MFPLNEKHSTKYSNRHNRPMYKRVGFKLRFADSIPSDQFEIFAFLFKFFSYYRRIKVTYS